MSRPAPAHALWTAQAIAGFALLTLIWGSTWFVIRGQLGEVAPTWSVTYRFVIAAAGMFALARIRGEPLMLRGPSMRLAAMFGLLQFCGNFQFVYAAENYVTSGVVSVLFALLIAPNAALARVFLGHRAGSRFWLGASISIAGIALLLLHELRASPEGNVPLGVALALGGVLCASSANVIQASEPARAQPIATMIAWGMVWGVAANIAIGLATVGPPTFDASPAYFGGLLYLALFGSVIAFPLYFWLIREMGAARAAYNGVAVPVVAMTISTLFEGYRWTLLAGGGAALALAGMVIALSGRD